ncbi:MAG: TonB-dependent receptor [Polymorphobacter sp.]|uniref:TonB-dependent receptor n=1 Tax=Polymorphobacter sp. TaxID=1909290 RepID=UPI003A863604
MIVRRSLLASLMGSVALGGAVQAQTQAPSAGDSMLHGGISPEIIVTAPFPRDRFSLTTAAAVLEGDTLVRETRPTIGETLSRQPGVSTTFFGPGASRPILRGQDAERVRVLTDGIGSFDVSNTSPDHAVAINPFLVDRVEVVRGPSALLYGSNAIGGVVNIVDRRIPREVPDEPVHVDASAVYGSAADERGGAGSVDLPLFRRGDGSALVLHADGSYLKTGDYRTGDFVYSAGERARGEAEGGEAAEQAALRGRVPNSDVESYNYGGGFAWFAPGGGQLGVAVSHLRSDYAVPNALPIGFGEGEDTRTAFVGDGRPFNLAGGEEGEEGPEQNIRLDMRQTRVDARALVPMTGGFEALKFRFGYADYRHDEIEDNGEIGTSFFNDAFEGRLELVQRAKGNWQGASGVQYVSRRFEVVGEEAYIPLNQTSQFGLFTLQEYDFGDLKIDAGARYENTSVNSQPLGVSRTFNTFSGALGASLLLSEGWRLALSATHSERAASAEELFSNGAHKATQAIEIGDVDFTKETSNGVEAVLRGRGDGWRIEASAFFTRFRNFIFLNPTGVIDEDEELPIFEYAQAGARFWGAEIDAALTLADLGETRVEVTGLLDFTRADLLGGLGPVPRIPPLRMLGGVQAGGGAFGGRIEVEHATAQRRVAVFEGETDAWTMVNASINWKPLGADSNTLLMVSANNIFDVEARRHSSFLKNVAPLPGRDIRVTARVSF